MFRWYAAPAHHAITARSVKWKDKQRVTYNTKAILHA